MLLYWYRKNSEAGANKFLVSLDGGNENVEEG
jgi:hypothetical protein